MTALPLRFVSELYDQAVPGCIGNGPASEWFLRMFLTASVSTQTAWFSSGNCFARGSAAKTLEDNPFDVLTLRYSQIRNLNRSVILLGA